MARNADFLLIFGFLSYQMGDFEYIIYFRIFCVLIFKMEIISILPISQGDCLKSVKYKTLQSIKYKVTSLS